MFCSEQGKVTVIEAGPACRILAVNQLDGRIMSTPAVAGRSLILRTDTHLYRIERTPASVSKSDRRNSSAGNDRLRTN